MLLMEKEEVRFETNMYKRLIDRFTSSGKNEKAEKLVMKMHEEGLKADAHLYNLIIRSYCKAGTIKMTERSIAPNFDTY